MKTFYSFEKTLRRKPPEMNGKIYFRLQRINEQTPILAQAHFDRSSSLARIAQIFLYTRRKSASTCRGYSRARRAVAFAQ